jgi:hypothetical protein
MVVVFTDIDGVFNSNWTNRWNPNSIKLYNKLVKEFNLTVVISSTRRLNKTIPELQEMLNEQGIEATIHDYTTDLDMIDRGLEIKDWLNKNECTNYIVFDDNTADIVPYVKNVIKCRSWLGITEDEYDEAVKILSNK